MLSVLDISCSIIRKIKSWRGFLNRVQATLISVYTLESWNSGKKKRIHTSQVQISELEWLLLKIVLKS